jgi:hypothetical protein
MTAEQTTVIATQTVTVLTIEHLYSILVLA